MSKLHFDLVSPERLLFSADVDQVDVPGAEGDFGVLANHAPVMATLRSGLLSVRSAGANPEKYYIRGGFAEVTLRGLTVLAEEAVALADLDLEALNRQIGEAEEDVTDAKDQDARRLAEDKLGHLRSLRLAAG